MRYFNPTTKTEYIVGMHDVSECTELPDDNWFFTTSRIPEGKELSVNDKGEPVLIDSQPNHL
ncbi:Uncharacterised protein [Yersinia pekkanenii]|uniref:Uncharacterized protein n=1 Tax=Yersinia pekkanenii TaxID=1288385 RepID=A0A0T9Q3K0_9GAMM|nr:hypothetical protein [Yersinia pekkanenii]CNH94379.1 Uncharacterised protein [Yersinia pekkanenii]CRY68506.1 Uncharacterised protein [Yersinia pekkanenii]